ncbi:MAG: adenylyltransferase/cytidyltransferase family protein [Planctomycetia bacterium]|nr:adenylyltransferase/cytidyltransferase family protein [Planctomycetia bacterium]MCC7314259.1 adenylyltransferase/cytidyltransferase family protein [Planctomycetota bacterium]
MNHDSPSSSPPPTTDFRRKIVSIDFLKAAIDAARMSPADRPGAPIFVQCHGCFDIVHPGHIRYLQFAKSQGSVLIVSITGDAAIDKGSVRPYIPQELRAENLAALEIVDYVVIDPNPTASKLLATVKPDIYVKGEEYAVSRDPRFLDEKKVVESYGGRVLFSSGQVVFSSTRLGEGMERSAGDRDELADARLGHMCRRHHISSVQLVTTLEAMRGKRVVILGDLAIEEYVLCDAKGLAGESPMMSLTELDRREHLGAAAILAAQCAALGASPVLITVLGRDESSTRAVKQLEDRGVTILAAARRDELPRRTRFLVDDQKMLKLDRGAPRPLDSAGQRRVIDLALTAAGPIDLALYYNAGYGLFSSGLLEQLGVQLRERAPILAGMAAEPNGSLLHMTNADLLHVSERRLRSATADYAGGLSSSAYDLMAATSAAGLIVTLGKRGLVTFDRPTHDRTDPAWIDRLLSEHFPSFASHVVDRLGAAECQLAVAALARAGGATLMQSAYLAQAVAALQVVRQGPLEVSLDQLENWLRRRPELADPAASDARSGTPREDDHRAAPSANRRVAQEAKQSGRAHGAKRINPATTQEPAPLP